ncbi:MAG: DHH family phosphoesterase [archaeon]
MFKAIEKFGEDFKNISKEKVIQIISHYDTDGITSAAIMMKALQRDDRKFSVKIIKQLEGDYLEELKKEAEEKKEVLFFLDLGSSNLKALENIKTDVFILDHHEIPNNSESPNVRIVNPHMFSEEVSSAGLCYLFTRQLNQTNRNLASLAIVGMVGDMLEKTLSRVNNYILKEAEDITIKKGLLIFSSTRPLHKALEFSSEIYIPGVTGSSIGAAGLLKEADIKTENGTYRTLIDLNPEEMSRLIIAIMLRRADKERNDDSIIGNIYLTKFFNRVEDVRELSTLINACSRLGHSDVALALCLGDTAAKTKAEEVYNSYKYEIIQALNWVAKEKKAESKGLVIINARSNIRDTIIGTVTSILACSGMYDEGTILIGMANQDKNIKVSARISGRENKTINLQKIVTEILKDVGGGGGGGHAKAAGCVIPLEKEQEFIESAKKLIEKESMSIKI